MFNLVLEHNNQIGEDKLIERALRPQTFDDYIGQNDLINKLKISIQAAKQREEPLDHVLLTGNSGTGKTTIANIIANTFDHEFRSINAPSVKSVADLLEIFIKSEGKHVLFLDEIHRLEKRVEETLYSAMEDYQISFKLPNGQFINQEIHPFCLIGATTVPGKMSAPLRDRFGILYNMQSYSIEQLGLIIEANAKKLNLNISDTS